MSGFSRTSCLQRAAASVWLRFPDEASACPACSSSRITIVDVFPIARDTKGRHVSFLTGCRECGLLFANPPPTREELQHFYSEEGTWAESQRERTTKLAAEYAKRLRRKKPFKKKSLHGGRALLLDALAPYVNVHAPPPGAKALDVGCGDGKFLDRLQDQGWETYGVEPSTGVAFVRHHRLEAPPQDRSFDLVVLRHVLEHVTEPLGLLRQVAGALRDGGVLFISVPRLETLAQHRDFRYCLNARTHVVCFSEACLQNLLARAGFDFTARLSRRELDDALTDGKPVWLHIVARRTATALAQPGAPLSPGLEALRRYSQADGRLMPYIRRLLPVRLRAAWMNRARERRWLQKRRRTPR